MPESTALIGYSGFVGGNLRGQRHFDALFNSSNVADLAGRSFDLVVCAGVSAVKWMANRDPEADRAGIKRLTDALETVHAREMVLISTIDVYPDPSRTLDETADLDPSAGQPYGRHRLELERWIQDRFEITRIVRLPALFGPGLRKNAVYDLLNDNNTAAINPAGRFQWYPVERLWSDIERARACGLGLVNLFTAPVTMQLVVDSFFPGAVVGPASEPAPSYAVQTRFAPEFGGRDGYVLGADQSLGAMARYIAAERAAQRTAGR